ncbi:hypothetical protein GM661_13385 [Iocasia frigidifontis]|uniref:N-acetyltransferase domain-containing protein n=1 Tax=Iocasia fonsfrigidae TaxID=2682810 RepID=A0A8A7KK82_9FIRM|nr:hypothetical protein GM661_13385 [Iocasia fonsfrigidae]
MGKCLLNEAVMFCKESNYKRVFLITFDVLAVASKLYTSFGFQKVKEKQVFLFGKNLIEQCFELYL